MDLQEPKLPEFYSPGRTFLSAFAMGAAISARRQQLEQNLQEMDLKRREAEAHRVQQQQNYELNVQQLGETTRYHNAEIQNQAAIQKRLTKAATEKSSADALEADRLLGLTENLATLRKSAKLGTQAYEDGLNNAQLEYSDIWSDPAAKRVWGADAARHVKASGVLTQSLSKAQQDYNMAVKGVGSNYKLPTEVVSNYFANPNVWRSKKEGGVDKMYVPYGESAVPFQPGEKDVGDKYKGAVTVDKSVYDSIQAKRAMAYPTDPSQQPALRSLPPGMAPGSVPTRIKVVSPDGKQFTVPQEQLQQAIEQGYSKVE